MSLNVSKFRFSTRYFALINMFDVNHFEMQVYKIAMKRFYWWAKNPPIRNSTFSGEISKQTNKHNLK